MARDAGRALVVEGLVPLQKALKRAEGNADKHLQRKLREAAKPVLESARSYAPTGPRPKRAKSPILKSSLRISVTQRGVSVYSNAPHAYVQDRGGRVGRYGQVIRRASASGYMTRAVNVNRSGTRERLESVLESLSDDFAK